ncbi:hypothetical protein SEA_MOSSY_53 [Gordonia phage Mossy]|nr:hypothetical protein SEA_MOSSY_53 [Gordonia phage Mossy]
MIPAVDYAQQNPGLVAGDICPQCEDSTGIRFGVCWYCACGCDLCERPDPLPH